MNTVMGIDMGTQSIKVLIYDPASKTTLAKASHPFDLITRDDGSAEQEASWWIDGFKQCLKSFDAKVLKSVVAIGVSGQQHGFVPVSGSGDVLAPVKLWCDTSTVAECDEIMAAVGGEQACRELAGNSVAAGFTASKILWLKKNKPEAYAKMATVMLPHDYLNFYLSGERVMEYGDASGTALLDVRTRTWSTDLLAAIDSERDLAQCLPRLISAEAPAGKILPSMAKALGLSEDVIVSSGGGDNMMAAIGTGNVSTGKLTASMGTSGTLFGYADKPVVDAGGDLAAFCSSTGGWLPLLCTMNCTVATEQVRKLFEFELSDVDTLAERIQPGADGVLTLPYYTGERTPDLPHGKAVIFGLDLSNSSRAHLLRSAMEAAVFGLKTGLLAFQRNGMAFTEVTLTGGGSSSRVWCQIVANILNLPVKVLKEKENAAFGALLQALWCYESSKGERVDLQSLVDEHLSVDNDLGCEPQAEQVARYEDVYENYQALLEAVRPLYKK